MMPKHRPSYYTNFWRESLHNMDIVNTLSFSNTEAPQACPQTCSWPLTIHDVQVQAYYTDFWRELLHNMNNQHFYFSPTLKYITSLQAYSWLDLDIVYNGVDYPWTINLFFFLFSNSEVPHEFIDLLLARSGHIMSIMARITACTTWTVNLFSLSPALRYMTSLQTYSWLDLDIYYVYKGVNRCMHNMDSQHFFQHRSTTSMSVDLLLAVDI